MTVDAKAALFIMLGQAAERTVAKLEDIVPQDSLFLSPSYDLAPIVPDKVRRAAEAAEIYKLFFVFEGYLREFVVEVLSKDGTETTWWDKVPNDVQVDVTRLEETEESKGWMALGSRDKSALLTLPQLLKLIEHNWKDSFSEPMRDKSLIHEARLLVHLRNTICHMSGISTEEADRVRQTMRDWFRVVAP
ncbi:MAG: Swt1 family HEPN domain-containing protein [Xanthobacteraceae bacterium]